MLMDRRYHTNANTNTKKVYHEVRKKKGSNYTTTIKPKIVVLDIEKENRLSKVISLYSKGLSQEATSSSAIAILVSLRLSWVFHSLQFS